MPPNRQYDLPDHRYGSPTRSGASAIGSGTDASKPACPAAPTVCRKAGAATAAENGATTKQLMAIFGWLTCEQAEMYVEAANREKLATDGMGLLVRR